VVTIREINPFAAKGIMKINDLLVLFKGNRFIESEEIISFIVDLLSKFELALTWDNEHLLIPSLLPSEAILKFSNQDIRIGIVSKKKTYNDHLKQNSSLNDPDFYLRLQQKDSIITSSPNANIPIREDKQISSLFSNVKLTHSYSQSNLVNKLNLEFLYECKPINNSNLKTEELMCQNSIRRLYSLSYLPSGFFSRLITRILCDNILKDCLLELIEIEYCFLDNAHIQMGDEASSVDSLIDFVCQEAEWKCWQSGIELKYLDYTLIKIKELIPDPLVDMNNKIINKEEIFLNYPILYRDCENEFKLKSSNKQFAFVECYASFKNYKIVKTSNNQKTTNSFRINNKNSENEYDDIENENETLVKIFCNRQITIKIFALIIEIIDNLLEDWYPDLGTRFMQDSKGDYLVTRLAPCSKCVRQSIVKNKKMKKSQTDSTSLTQQDNLSSSLNSNNDVNNWAYLEIDEKYRTASIVSESSFGDEESDQKMIDFQFCSDNNENEKIKLKLSEKPEWIFCFMLDDVSYSVLKNVQLICPKHGNFNYFFTN
jgi:hypothetical protein